MEPPTGLEEGDASPIIIARRLRALNPRADAVVWQKVCGGTSDAALGDACAVRAAIAAGPHMPVLGLSKSCAERAAVGPLYGSFLGLSDIQEYAVAMEAIMRNTTGPASLYQAFALKWPRALVRQIIGRAEAHGKIAYDEGPSDRMGSHGGS